MPELTTLTNSIHALAQHVGATDRTLASLFTQCIGELAKATDRITQIESWTVAHGYPGYASTEQSSSSTDLNEEE